MERKVCKTEIRQGREMTHVNARHASSLNDVVEKEENSNTFVLPFIYYIRLYPDALVLICMNVCVRCSASFHF